jgi:hypothetical protein
MYFLMTLYGQESGQSQLGLSLRLVANSFFETSDVNDSIHVQARSQVRPSLGPVPHLSFLVIEFSTLTCLGASLDAGINFMLLLKEMLVSSPRAVVNISQTASA